MNYRPTVYVNVFVFVFVYVKKKQYQGSYVVWKSLEFDLSIFQIWKSMEKRKQCMEKNSVSRLLPLFS